MSKIHISTKDAKKAFRNIYMFRYCEIQNLLRYDKPVFFNAGVHGWNWDGYIIEGNLIITGYRNLIGKRCKWDKVQEYEKSAKQCTNAIQTHRLLEELISKNQQL